MSNTEWAHVAAGVVENISIGTDPVDAAWLAAVREEFDAVVNVTASRAAGAGPEIGWSYDVSTFAPPSEPGP